MTDVAVATTESASRSGRAELEADVALGGEIAGGVAVGTSPLATSLRSFPADGTLATAGLRSAGTRGRDGLPPPPRLIESPAANSNPSRRSSEMCRQRPSAPTLRNAAGASSYPNPADHEVQVLENDCE